MSNSDETMPLGEQDPNATDAAPADRKPWVTPELERLDLREAMTGSSPTGTFDGVGSS